MKIEIVKGPSKVQPYYWRIVASNGKTLATSETYHRLRDAQSAALSVRQEFSQSSIAIDYLGSEGVRRRWWRR